MNCQLRVPDSITCVPLQACLCIVTRDPFVLVKTVSFCIGAPARQRRRATQLAAIAAGTGSSHGFRAHTKLPLLHRRRRWACRPVCSTAAEGALPRCAGGGGPGPRWGACSTGEKHMLGYLELRLTGTGAPGDAMGDCCCHAATAAVAAGYCCGSTVQQMGEVSPRNRSITPFAHVWFWRCCA